jgi:hypothetical protein
MDYGKISKKTTSQAPGQAQKHILKPAISEICKILYFFLPLFVEQKMNEKKVKNKMDEIFVSEFTLFQYGKNWKRKKLCNIFFCRRKSGKN